MINIGKFNTLTVLERQLAGIILDGQESGAVFLPERNVPANTNIGDVLDVFVYRENDRQLIATTEVPLAEVGDVAWLKVVAINSVGAFLSWGLPKDLLVPFNEQFYKLELGRNYLVKVLFDETHGIYATPKIEAHLYDEAFYLTEGQAVNLLIADKTDLGIKAIVNHTHWGLLYHNEVFQPLRKGQKIGGYIKQIREDDRRIDLSLYPHGYAKVGSSTGNIVEQLKHNNGYLPLCDSSSPEAIYAQFGISKKVFKQAIGALYKQRLITIEDNGIRLS